MGLNLHDGASGTPVFTGGISVDNMSWWFWIKAGMGLTMGVCAAGAVAAVFWSVVWVGILAAFARGLAR